MRAKDLMTSNVECIPPGMFVKEAARRMRILDTGFLPVCENDRLIGAITDRDIVIRGVSEGKDLENCEARDLMTEDVLWCYDDQTADEIAEYMASKEIRRVLILDRNKRLCGVVSIGDLAKRADEQTTGETIREIAEAPRQVA
jgi:CBS domain-containing protein